MAIPPRNASIELLHGMRKMMPTKAPALELTNHSIVAFQKIRILGKRPRHKILRKVATGMKGAVAMRFCSNGMGNAVGVFGAIVRLIGRSSLKVLRPGINFIRQQHHCSGII
jgi:hypothetical protein